MHYFNNQQNFPNFLIINMNPLHIHDIINVSTHLSFRKSCQSDNEALNPCELYEKVIDKT
jgi:hypothetical protein